MTLPPIFNVCIALVTLNQIPFNKCLLRHLRQTKIVHANTFLLKRRNLLIWPLDKVRLWQCLGDDLDLVVKFQIANTLNKVSVADHFPR